MVVRITLICLLTGCGPGVSFSPSVHCQDQDELSLSVDATWIEQFTVRGKDLVNRCGLIINFKTKSYIGEPAVTLDEPVDQEPQKPCGYSPRVDGSIYQRVVSGQSRSF